MRMRGILAIVVAALLLSTAAANAADKTKKEESDPLKGLYFQLGGLASLDAFDAPTELDARDSWGLDTRIGYRFHPNLGAEGHFQWAQRYKLTQNAQNVGTVETYTVTLNGKVFLFDGPFTPYVVAGGGIQSVKKDGALGTHDPTEFVFRIGGGVEVRFWEGLGAYGEVAYLQPATSLSDLGAVPISFGFKYAFQ